MNKRTLPTIETLHKLLSCDYAAGILTWRVRTKEHFGKMTEKQGEAWNRRYAGKRAFTSKLSCGYYQGIILGEHYLAHCVIFAMGNGEWSKDEVDHKNHIRGDDRFDNLREATSEQQNQNRSLFRNNKSGHVGVSWYKRTGQWRACIMVDKKQKTLGYFDEIEDAIDARQTASDKHGYHANHGKPLC